MFELIVSYYEVTLCTVLKREKLRFEKGPEKYIKKYKQRYFAQ